MPGEAQGGHAIDVRGPALDILAAMGLRGAVSDQRMRLKGVSIVDQAGVEVWRSETMTISGGRLDSPDIEILRDRLSRVLVNSLSPSIEILRPCSVTAIENATGGVVVTLSDGARRQFDLVVGADGLKSNVRNLVFGPEQSFLDPFGIALAPFSAPNFLGLVDWQLRYRNEAGNGYMIYTTPENDRLRLSFSVPARLEDEPLDRAAQVEKVKVHCAELGWETPRFIAAMEAASDFYLGLVAQVKMARWSRGRAVLVGDAAYCPSPYSGQGTSLALIGAYVLAQELARTPGDFTAAFTRYEAKLRPFVAQNQAIADLTRDDRFTRDPGYYSAVVEPAIDRAKAAITLEGLG